MRKIKRYMLAVVILFFCIHLKAIAGTQVTFYVDATNGNDNNTGTSVTASFKTILKAQTAVRSVNGNMIGDIYVYLRGGNYILSATLVFDDRDAGTNGYNIYYAAFPNETPIISGERKIAGWVLHDNAKQIYRAAAGSTIRTRQLFINGRRATRARTFDTLANLTIDTAVGHTTTTTAIASWKNTSDIELVYIASWTNPRCGISSVSVNNGIALLTMKQPGWSYCTNKGLTSIGGGFSKAPWYIENAYELIDSAGEWYLDRTGAINGTANTFYYKPFPGEDMSNVDVCVPVLERLITVQGRSIATPAHHIQFVGLVFQYATWLLPNGNNGHSDAQNNILRWKGRGERIVDAAAIAMRYANDVNIQRCVFRRLGGLGVEMYPGCQNNNIIGCSFTDISANGIQIGDVYGALNDTSYEAFCNPVDARLINKNISIVNNYMDKCGVEYRSSSAIAAVFPQAMYIGHNEIGNMPQTGIHLGWGQGGTNDVSVYSIAKNNRINNNYVRNTVAELDDSSPIYVCGAQDSVNNFSRIDSNHCISSRDNGLYFDGGSCWWKADNNVVQDIKNVIINLNRDKYIRDIAVTNTYAEKNHYWNLGLRTTIQPMKVTSNGSWPLAALALMDSAGLQDDYVDIRSTSYLIDHFNNNPTGSAPAGWITSTSGGTVTTSNINGNGDQCVMLFKPAAVNAVTATNTFKPVSGKVILTFKVRTEALTDWKVLPHILDMNGIVAASIIMKDGNLQLYKGSGSYTLIQPFIAGQWYSIKAVLNTETKKVDVYVNGIQKVYQDNFRNRVSDISQLQFGIDANYLGTAYIDNVKVYADQNFVNENFNDLLIGKEPLGWINTTSSGTVTVDSIAGYSNRFIKMVKAASASFLLMSKKIDPVYKNIVATAKVYSSNTLGWKNAYYLFDRFDKVIASVIFRDGNIQVYNGSAFTTAMPFVSNNWYKIKLLLNTETNKFDVLVNDTLRITQASFRNNVAEVSKIEFGIGEGYTGSLFVDDVQLYNAATLTSSTLPVQFKTLTATAIDNKKVELKWITSSEINNKMFIIQRSQNGIDFNTIDTVLGKGNSTVHNSYIITDAKPLIGNNFYRMLQVDYNGATTLSNVVNMIIKVNNKNNFSIFPNPSSLDISLVINANIGDSVFLIITDKKGRVVLTKNISINRAKQQEKFSTATLSQGLYNVTMVTKQGNISQQFIKQ
jgi:Right handed beta helix region